MSLSQETLRQLVTYDAATGEMRWAVTRKGAQIGALVGAPTAYGYRRATICGARQHVHRLVWLYAYGDWPDRDIDHINGDKSDNRLSNLRLATRPQNIANSGPRPKNKTGFRGVSLCAHTGKWRASITLEGRSRNLGRFGTPEDAARAYDAAALAHHNEFARLNFPEGITK